MAWDKVTSLAGVETAYTALRKKYQRSTMWFVILNVATFTITALTIILSLWAVRVGNADAKVYFIGIAVLAAIIAFLSAVITSFTFGQASRKASAKIEEIKKEEQLYDQKAGEYADNATRFEAFIRKITTIYNG